MQILGLGQCVRVRSGLLGQHDGVVIGDREIDGAQYCLVRVHVYAWYHVGELRGLGAGESIGDKLSADGRSVAALEAGG